jgi:hypothetical protein
MFTPSPYAKLGIGKRAIAINGLRGVITDKCVIGKAEWFTVKPHGGEHAQAFLASELIVEA